MERKTISYPDTALLSGRVLLVALYAWSATGKWADLAGLAGALASKNLPAASVLAYFVAAAELLGAIAIAIGFKTRAAAAGLLLFTALATLLFHAFWLEPPGSAAEAQLLQAMKNIGLIGGFLLLIGSGPGRYSIETIWPASWRSHAAVRVS